MALDAPLGLAGLVRAAALQRRLLFPWLGDRKFLKSGGSITYFVDTDVVVLHTAPQAEHVFRYSQVFDDDRRLVEALAIALTDHIFFRLNPSRPLLVIPPTDQEIRRVFDAVAHRAQSEYSRARDEIPRLRKIIKNLKHLTDNASILETLRNEAPHLVQILAGPRGRNSELRRFGQLLGSARIAPVGFALESHLISDPVLENALAAPVVLIDIAAVRELRENWFTRLMQTKSKSTNRLRIFTDAEMLARLEWINKRLDARHRVLLLTGDHAIDDAARTYFPNSQDDSFADLYLRHPRAFLAESDVLSPDRTSSPTSGDDESRFVQWLDTFLADLGTSQVNYRAELDRLIREQDDELEKRAEQVLRVRPSLVSDFRANWNRYTHNLLLLRVPQPAANDDDRLLLSLAVDLGTMITKVQGLLLDRVRKDWEACFEAATDAGYGLLVHHAVTRRIPPRNPPVIWMKSFDAFWEFVQNVLHIRHQHIGNVKVYNEKIREVFSNNLPKLTQEDPSGYTRFLVYALLFAAEQSWHVASILSGVALDIAASEPSLNISGREAAYLRAVALRHSTLRAANLHVVKQMLDRAEKCLTKDRRSRPDLQAGEIRFAAERTALDITYHLFHEFADQSIPGNVLSLDEVQRKIENLLNKIEIPTSVSKQTDREIWVAEKVERNLLTNFFMVAILRWKKGELGRIPAYFGEYFDRYSLSLRRSNLPPTFLAEAVFLAAGWLISSDKEQKRGWRRRLAEHFTGNAIAENSVMPYDANRFEFLRRLPTL